MSVTLDASMSTLPAKSRFEDSADLEDLTRAAADGDRRAWDQLYQRYQPLISRMCRRYGLNTSDAADVSQTVWMQLVRYAGQIREPRSLPGWLATTVKHECLAVVQSGRNIEPADPMMDRRLQQIDRTEIDEHLHLSDRRRSLHEGLSQLRPHQRELVLLLIAEPQMSYQEISGRLGMPVGSIGPTRARCLHQLRLVMAN